VAQRLGYRDKIALWEVPTPENHVGLIKVWLEHKTDNLTIIWELIV
jgi:hypothetical protein